MNNYVEKIEQYFEDADQAILFRDLAFDNNVLIKIFDGQEFDEVILKGNEQDVQNTINAFNSYII